MPNGIITLTTDFGIQDIFVGVMKGVVMGINAKAQLIDITHNIPAHDIETGAFLFNAAYKMFPAGTTHVVVIDPGVGGNRKGIAAQTDDYYFVAPDNGILSEALRNETVCKTVSLEASEFFRSSSLSNTFHGRDLFAPVAAHITLNVPLSKLGPIVAERVSLSLSSPIICSNLIKGIVRYIDRFGNVITNISHKHFIKNQSTKGKFEIKVNEIKIKTLSLCYENGSQNDPIALFNSFNLLEIALPGGNAAKQLAIANGDPVNVKFYP